MGFVWFIGHSFSYSDYLNFEMIRSYMKLAHAHIHAYFAYIALHWVPPGEFLWYEKLFFEKFSTSTLLYATRPACVTKIYRKLTLTKLRF